MGRGAMGSNADVMDAPALEGAVTSGRERFGRLDILVNNAGGFSLFDWPESPLDERRRPSGRIASVGSPSTAALERGPEM
jgi:NAD(P)-dependent dehydrogenase (short-subunit alcohol dehydrogenase family)